MQVRPRSLTLYRAAGQQASSVKLKNVNYTQNKKVHDIQKLFQNNHSKPLLPKNYKLQSDISQKKNKNLSAKKLSEISPLHPNSKN